MSEYTTHMYKIMTIRIH